MFPLICLDFRGIGAFDTPLRRGYSGERTMAEDSDAVDEYRRYLARFEAKVGTSEFGAYAKHNGRLIKKLTYDEFESRLVEYQEVDRAYKEILANGDTINDVLVKVLRERADELLIDRKL